MLAHFRTKVPNVFLAHRWLLRSARPGCVRSGYIGLAHVGVGDPHRPHGCVDAFVRAFEMVGRVCGQERLNRVMSSFSAVLFKPTSEERDGIPGMSLPLRAHYPGCALVSGATGIKLVGAASALSILAPALRDLQGPRMDGGLWGRLPQTIVGVWEQALLARPAGVAFGQDCAGLAWSCSYVCRSRHFGAEMVKRPDHLACSCCVMESEVP